MSKNSSDSSFVAGVGKKVSIPDKSFPYLPLVAAGTVVWAVVLSKRINRMLLNRYGSIVYQIRRPDSISNRYTAFKFFTVGGLVVPGVTLGTVYLLFGRETGRVYELKGETIAISRATSHGLYSYASNASIRLERIANGARQAVIPDGMNRMGDDLRRDISALKRWLNNLF